MKVRDAQELLRVESLVLYRIARAKYANLSGVGAAAYPGRWNEAGEEAIYTSTEVGVPVLEKLVHTPKNLIPSKLALMRLRIHGEWQIHEFFKLSRSGSASFLAINSVELASKLLFLSRLKSGSSQRMTKPFAMAVPSVIAPVWNVVLYPGRPGFWEHVFLETVESFQLDPRLFPDQALPEVDDE